jgi:predicted aconitase with swiveling domain
VTEVYWARGTVPGKASGSAVVSRRAFTFAHGVDPSSGRVTDVHSDLNGTSLGGKVLFYPFGKGSTTGSAWFLETARLGNAPAGVVTQDPDLSVIIGSLLARSVYSKSIPVLFAGSDVGIAVETGEQVEVDGATGEIVVG